MLEDPVGGIELQGTGVPHVLSVVQVGDGEVQGEGHQSRASSNGRVLAEDLSTAMDCRSGRREHYVILHSFHSVSMYQVSHVCEALCWALWVQGGA